MKDQPELLILYATQTGNAQDAAERLGREAEHRGCAVRLLSMDEYDAVGFSSFPYSLCFVANEMLES